MTTNKMALTTQVVAVRFNKQLHHAEGKADLRKKGGEWMRKIRTVAVIAGLLFSLTVSAQNKQTSAGTNKFEPLQRDLEIQLALSALPPHLRDSATVYILNPDKGFEVARKGTNEFHTFVARTGDDAMRGA